MSLTTIRRFSESMLRPLKLSRTDQECKPIYQQKAVNRFSDKNNACVRYKIFTANSCFFNSRKLFISFGFRFELFPCSQRSVRPARIILHYILRKYWYKRRVLPRSTNAVEWADSRQLMSQIREQLAWIWSCSWIKFPVSQRSWESYPSITPTRTDLDSFIPRLIWAQVVALHFSYHP